MTTIWSGPMMVSGLEKTYKTHSWKSTLIVVNAIGHLGV